jgi:hypothetical protein
VSPAKRVEVLVAAGAPLERIALEFELTVDELFERFADEIEHGAASCP